MVADVVTLVFQLSLVGAAATILVGLVRDELADLASAAEHEPARFPEVPVVTRTRVDAVGAGVHTRGTGRALPSRSKPTARTSGAARRRLATTPR